MYNVKYVYIYIYIYRLALAPGSPATEAAGARPKASARAPPRWPARGPRRRPLGGSSGRRRLPPLPADGLSRWTRPQAGSWTEGPVQPAPQMHAHRRTR